MILYFSINFYLIQKIIKEKLHEKMRKTQQVFIKKVIIPSQGVRLKRKLLRLTFERNDSSKECFRYPA